MRILIPSTDTEATLNSRPSRILGSAKSFLVYNTDDESFVSIKNSFFDNTNSNIARDLKDLGIDHVITENICQTCHGNMKIADITVWEDNKSLTIREAYQKYLIGGLFIMKKVGNLKMHKKAKVDPEVTNTINIKDLN